MSKSVLIVNPIGSSRTSQKRADEFVRRGEAEILSDGSIRFIEVNQGKRIIERQEHDAPREKTIFAWSGSRKDSRFCESDCRPGIFRS